MIPREMEGRTGWLSVSQKENRVRMSLVRGTPRTRHEQCTCQWKPVDYRGRVLACWASISQSRLG